MPNWATGEVVLRGNKIEDLQKFVLRFGAKERRQGLVDAGLDDNYQYFYRSFIHLSTLDAYYNLFQGVEEVDNSDGCGSLRLAFYADFAWSMTGCLVDQFLGDGSEDEEPSGKTILSVMEAAKLHGVWFEAYAEELGMCFHEHVLVNNLGEILASEGTDVAADEVDGETVVSGGYDIDDGSFPYSI